MARRRLHIIEWIILGVIASALIAGLIFLWVRPHVDTITFSWGGKPVELLEPSWLYLLALIPFFFVVSTQSLTDLSVPQQMLQATVRGALIAAIALALTRPAWSTTDNKVATVILVDVSESVSDKQIESARQYIDQLTKAKGAKDKVYVVTFAQRPRRVNKKDGQWQLTRHAKGSAHTDIQAAVQLGYGLFPKGYLPRMVILSDGNQTRGDLLAESYRAQEFGVKVSWKTFAQNRVKEIRVLSLKVPDEIKENQPFFLRAEVWSTHKEEVELALKLDGGANPLEPTKKVTLEEGKNRIKFKAVVKRAGFSRFRLDLKNPKGDTEKKNNFAVVSAPVKGKPQVLYVEGGRMRNPGSSRYLERALTHQNIEVHARGPRGLPSSLDKLKKYDLVVVSDVPAHFVGMGQMSALESYVKGGGGLIMAGGEDSFGSGGYQGTRMEKIMPVRFDSEKTREQPNVAIVLVIDRSGSMGGPKIEGAKEAARATAEVLSPSDLISVIAFDNRPRTIVRLQRASNRFRISTDISRLTAGGGTNIYPALKESFDILQTANAKVKHVIVLSDGQAPYAGIAALCQEMRAARITVSAVGIGDADRNLLNLIADNGEGRLYMTDDLSALPRIFMKETTEAQKSALVEDLVKAHVVKRVDAIEGTGVAGAPPLHGYVSTKPKAQSEVILISDLGEPILARWRVGAGTSVAWTSDVKNRWSVDWIRWGGYPKFWAQVVRTSMRRKVHAGYDMYAKVVDGRARITVDAVNSQDKFVNDLDTELHITDPLKRNPPRIVQMQQTAAGRYTADFQVDHYGSFNLTAVHRRGTQTVAQSRGSVALSYPIEYLRTTPDEEPLKHAAMVTGGIDKPNPPAVWKPAKGERIRYTEDLWPWVLLFVILLLVADTYLKRVRLFGYRTMEF